jgi:FAD/FMN-containing dehydrogenase
MPPALSAIATHGGLMGGGRARQVLDYLLPRGYTLPVLPEMDELTIGGLTNGYGGRPAWG